MTIFNWFRDYLWVLQAYLRGKVLRQKAYRPQDNLFRLPVNVNIKRMFILIRWWRIRPATVEELTALMSQELTSNNDWSISRPSLLPDHYPYIRWDGEKWSGEPTFWNDHHNFLISRK